MFSFFYTTKPCNCNEFDETTMVYGFLSMMAMYTGFTKLKMWLTTVPSSSTTTDSSTTTYVSDNHSDTCSCCSNSDDEVENDGDVDSIDSSDEELKKLNNKINQQYLTI